MRSSRQAEIDQCECPEIEKTPTELPGADQEKRPALPLTPEDLQRGSEMRVPQGTCS